MKKKLINFDDNVINGLIRQIEKEIKKPKKKRNNIKLDLRENNAVKYINKEWSYDLSGEWNGYGYEKLGKHLMIDNFVKAKNSLKKLETKKPKKTKKEKEIEKMKQGQYSRWDYYDIEQEYDKIQWSKRLCKLTGISEGTAYDIADSKIEYKEDRIEAVEDRQYDNFSKKREILINKMKRENPLRRIINEDHAQAILSAHDRHNNTNYESLLEEARDKAEYGEIDKSEVKEYARSNFLK